MTYGDLHISVGWRGGTGHLHRRYLYIDNDNAAPAGGVGNASVK